MAAEHFLTPGVVYRFRVRSRNARGYSQYSDFTAVGLGSLPAPPSSLVKDSSDHRNSDSTISLVWSELQSETLNILGYSLYADDGFGVSFTKVYEGQSPNALVTGLIASTAYSFFVTATNFNGEGAASQVTTIKSCVAPFDVSAPWLVARTALSVTLRWEEPANGGCSISSYSVFSDLGEISGPFQNLEPEDVENKPYKHEHTFTFDDSALTGKTIRFKLQASNEIGSSLSEAHLSVLLAEEPSKPPSKVERLSSSENTLTVQMPLVSLNGGSTLTEYELFGDDGLQSELASLYSGLNRTVDLPSVLGRSYRFKYRVKNVVGWSEFSEVVSFLAASVPAKPSTPPAVAFVDATLISLQLTSSSQNHGALITDFVLEFSDSSNFSELGVYILESSLVEISADEFGLTEGTHYFFRYRLRNSEGDSEASDITEVALLNPPAAPLAPAKLDEHSTLTSIYLAWSDSAGNELNVVGYELWMDSGSDGLFHSVFNGRNMPGVNYFTVTDL